MLQKGEPGPGNSMDTPIADFALKGATAEQTVYGLAS
jgi:hypothetical protein